MEEYGKFHLKVEIILSYKRKVITNVEEKTKLGNTPVYIMCASIVRRVLKSLFPN